MEVESTSRNPGSASRLSYVAPDAWQDILLGEVRLIDLDALEVRTNPVSEGGLVEPLGAEVHETTWHLRGLLVQSNVSSIREER